jgi:Type I restriction modification DNA specificity domain
MTKQKLLGELGHIRIGYSYRSAKDLESGDHPNYQALQLNALTNEGLLDWSKLSPIYFKGNPEQYVLRSGDVLFPLRGSRTIAVVVEDPPPNVLAVGAWAILTPEDRQVNGTYLVWYWNHPDISKQREHKLSKGSKIQFISMQDCKDFTIALPSLANQQKIAKIAKLRRQECELVSKIELLKDKLIDAATMQLVTKS